MVVYFTFVDAFLELKKMQTSSHDHFQRIFGDHEKRKLQLESHKKALEMRGQELEQREAKNEIDWKMLSEEIEKVSCFV